MLLPALVSASLPMNGVVDLGDWDFVRDGPKTVRQSWQMVPGKLVEPWQWSQLEGDTEVVAMPVYLNSVALKDGSFMPPNDVATLHTRLTNIPDGKHDLGVSLPIVYTSARWIFVVDGKQVIFEAGIVGEDEESSIPTMRQGLVRLSRASHIDVYLQVANFSSSWIGAVGPVVLGEYPERERAEHYVRIRGIAFTVVLLFAALTQLIRFLLRPQERAPLWFIGFSMSVGLIELCRVLLNYIRVPDNSVFELALRGPYVAAELAAVFLLLFCEDLLEPCNRILKRLTFVLVAGLLLCSLIAPIHIIDGPALSPFVFAGLLVVICVSQSVAKSMSGNRTKSTLVVSLGMVITAVVVAHDILIAAGVLEPPYLLAWGILFLVIAQTFALALKAEQEWLTADYLSRSLRDEVQERTKALDQRTQEAESARAALEKADREKTFFFQSISHELRTPLTLILAPLEGLKAAGQSESSVELIDRNARRLLKLVNQLLDFQKMATPGEHLVCRPLDLVAFLRSISGYFADASSHRGVIYSCGVMNVSLDLYSDKLFVVADSEALEKIVFNLLSNAFKYTNPGGSIVLVVSMDGDDVRITVEDTGCGIAPEDVDKLFEPFSQLDASQEIGFDGSGIGLSLVKELAEGMGSSYGVESTLGKGSAFWFTLPRTTEEPIEPPHALSGTYWEFDPAYSKLNVPVRPERAPLGVQNKVVLVVDDLPDMRQLISQTMEMAGYVTVEAGDGEDGLEIATQNIPDLILLDWMMQRMSGPQFLRKLRANDLTKGIPVVMLTARSDWESRLQAAEMGADAFLGKPFNQRELLSTVRNLLKLKEGELELKRANDSLEEFVHIVTHDLKSPAHTIQQFAAILDEGIGGERSPNVNTAIGHIQNLSGRMIRMISDLLQYSRVRHKPPVFETVSLRDCLQEALEQIDGQIQETGARVESVELPQIQGTWTLWTEIFQNLVSNGIKYNESDVPKVEVSMTDCDVHWEIAVLDNGIGVPKTERERVFLPFNRLHSSSAYEGTGLGLAFCKQVIEHHGGQIWMDLENDQGTCVKFTVPKNID